MQSFEEILVKAQNIPIQYQTQELKNLLIEFKTISEIYHSLNWELVKSSYDIEDEKQHNRLLKTFNQAKKKYQSLQNKIIKEYKKQDYL